MPKNQPPAVGINIKNCRKIKNISLEELSKRSGVSKSMLSQIEQGKTNPTVITVWKIASALDVQLEEILNVVDDVGIEVLRKEEAPIIFSEDKSCIIRVNSPIHLTDNLELYYMTFKPNGKISSAPHFPNSEEFLTVLSGQFKIYSGNNVSILNTGDSARYKGDRNHSIENLTDKEANAYLVVWFPK